MIEVPARSFGNKRFFQSKKKIFLVILIISILALLAFFYASRFVQTPPENFPINKPIVIEKGTGLRAAVKQMRNEGVIRSEMALFFYMLSVHRDESIKAGTYIFTQPINLHDLSFELIQGNNVNNLIRFTHTEGETVAKIAARAKETIKDFDADRFLAFALPTEGKLFPETYLIPENYPADELYVLMRNKFDEEIKLLETKITDSELSLDEIIILASIIEREANTSESKHLVSGILQNRLASDMYLQVDASLEYILDKPLSELTPEDLKIDSLYNTYLYKGLPPTPIGNPGLESIMAVLEPTSSDYLFYITGTDGEFYYAKNFEEHKMNVAKYLR